MAMSPRGRCRVASMRGRAMAITWFVGREGWGVRWQACGRPVRDLIRGALLDDGHALKDNRRWYSR